MITDLAEEIASRAQQPPFEAVVTRVREDRRRAVRRTAIGGALVAAAALVVVPRLGGDSADDQQPTNPGPSVSVPTGGLAIGVPELLARPQVSIVQVAGSDDGGVAALWQGCDGGDCGYAVLTSNGNAALGSVVVDSSVLSPTASGWLIHTSGGWRALASDGWLSGVTTAGEDGVRPGDEAVETAGGLGLLRGGRLLLLPSASGSATQAYVTPQGRLLEVTAAGDGSEDLRATKDGKHWTTIRSWRSGSGVAQVWLAGHGRTVAAVVLRDWLGGNLLVDRVDVSHDGGRTWITARGVDFAGGESENLSGLAVSVQGSVYLTTESDGLIRVDRDGNARVSALSSDDRGVFATTYEVCVLTGGWGGDRLQCSADDGASWSRQPVPGSSLVRRE